MKRTEGRRSKDNCLKFCFAEVWEVAFVVVGSFELTIGGVEEEKGEQPKAFVFILAPERPGAVTWAVRGGRKQHGCRFASDSIWLIHNLRTVRWWRLSFTHLAVTFRFPVTSDACSISKSVRMSMNRRVVTQETWSFARISTIPFSNHHKYAHTACNSMLVPPRLRTAELHRRVSQNMLEGIITSRPIKPLIEDIVGRVGIVSFASTLPSTHISPPCPEQSRTFPVALLQFSGDRSR